MSFTAFNNPPSKVVPQMIKAEPAAAAAAAHNKMTIKEERPQISGQTLSLLQAAFAERGDLLEGIKSWAGIDERFVQSLAAYVLALKQPASSATIAAAVASQPAQSSPQAGSATAGVGTATAGAEANSKKRKLDDARAASDRNGNDAAVSSWRDRSIRASHAGGDVSFSLPQRKKLRLEWIDRNAADLSAGGVRAMNPSGDVEFGVAWKDIDQIFILPVPEKAKPQHNVVIIPSNAHGLLPFTPGAAEPIVWTVFEPGPKETEAPPEPATITSLLNTQLKPFRKSVTLPDSSEFQSALTQAHRKDEAAYHIKAHRGSKEGVLYLLGPGIFFGFKKPLLFLPFEVIESISYTSVLQRTFNLNIATSVVSAADGSSKEEEIEFAMLDQADFAGIDEYIKRHGLHDASLAAGRKAKKYDVNKARGAGKDGKDGPATANGHADGTNGENEQDDDEEDGMTELQKAEQALQDEEDEMEEDYVDDDDDDGDDGSEGEGGSSEEDEEFDVDGEGEGEGRFEDGDEEDDEDDER